jgi:hypothetical protein
MPSAASTRTLSRVAGIAFIVTFVTAIAGALLYEPVLDDARYIVGAGEDTRIYLGATMELFLIIANLATALALFPVLKLQSEAGALGYVTARVIECTFIAVGILAVLAVVTLRNDATVADEDTLVVAGQSLVAIKDWTFVLGPGFVVGVGNGLLLGYLMYRSELVPRRMAWFGLIGGPLVCLSGLLVLFDATEAGSAVQGIATIPEIVWEAFLGIYLTFKGFRPSSPLFAHSPRNTA